MTSLAEYEAESAATDRVDWAEAYGRTIHLLGALGEYGSVLSELKKSRRDGDAYTGFVEHFSEELGDLLWYVAALARRVGVTLTDSESTERPLSGAPDSGLFRLGCALTELVTQIDSGRFRRSGVVGLFSTVLAEMRGAAALIGTTLEAVAEANLLKTRLRWKPDPDSPAAWHDAGSVPEEQLPRSGTIQFLQRTRGKGAVVILQSNGITIGDRLTDNAREDDGYRFHDAFHIAHAAVLGWSPVTRSLFRCKRKSDPVVDEVQDGARAQIAEESVSFQVFDYARERKYLEGLKTVDQDLLRRVLSLVKGLEAAERAPWEWELAIMRGYDVFRELRAKCGGWIRFDADARLIEYLAGPDSKP